MYITDVCHVKKFTLPANILTHSITDVFQSYLPSTAICVLSRQDYSNGSYSASPFAYQPNNLKSIHFSVESEHFPSLGYHPQFEDNNTRDYLRSYLGLYRGISQFQDVGSAITLEMFSEFYCFHVFSFNSDSSLCRDITPGRRVACANLHMQFNDTSNGVLQLFVFYITTETYKLDIQRNILVDFLL